MTATDITVAVPLLSMLAIASTTDLLARRIPNGVSLGGVFVGAITQTTLFGAGGLAMSIFGSLVCLVCFLPFYVGGGMAAGDVKLMAAVGAFLGPVQGLAACLCVLVAGAVLGTGCLLWTRAMNARAGSGVCAPAYDIGARIPYAGAIALGTTVVVLQPAFLTRILTHGGLA